MGFTYANVFQTEMFFGMCVDLHQRQEPKDVATLAVAGGRKASDWESKKDTTIQHQSILCLKL